MNARQRRKARREVARFALGLERMSHLATKVAGEMRGLGVAFERFAKCAATDLAVLKATQLSRIEIPSYGTA